MEQGKQALEVTVGAVQRDVEEVKTKKENESYVNTAKALQNRRIRILLQE